MNNNPILSIRNCKECNLCSNQLPLIQLCSDADVFWIGLSAVKTSIKTDTPLASNTNTGKLISSIEFFFPSISFYRTNAVKCVPLANEKIRYPSISEMRNCFFNLRSEINYLTPKVIFLLGKQVASFVLEKYGIKKFDLDEEFKYDSYLINEVLFVPIHHPSFILVYKRKKLSNYIKAIEFLISKNIKINEISQLEKELYKESVFECV